MKKFIYLSLLLIIFSCKSDEQKRIEKREIKEKVISTKIDSIAKNLECENWKTFVKENQLEDKYFVELKSSVDKSNKKFYFKINVDEIVPKNDSMFTILGSSNDLYIGNKDIIFEISGSNFKLTNVLESLRKKSLYEQKTIFTQIDSVKYVKFGLGTNVDIYSADDYDAEVINEFGNNYIFYGSFLDVIEEVREEDIEP